MYEFMHELSAHYQPQSLIHCKHDTSVPFKFKIMSKSFLPQSLPSPSIAKRVAIGTFHFLFLY